MNHTPLINSKHAILLAAIALSCPIAQGQTEGYLSTSTAAGTSEVGPTAAFESQYSQDGINQRARVIRQERTREAKRLVQEGRNSYSAGRYKEAFDSYKKAWEVLPDAPATRKFREFLRASLSDASIALAMDYGKLGRYDEAEQLLLQTLDREPNNNRARLELSKLRDPRRSNPALTPEHVLNVEEVQRLLNLGYGYLDLGRYDQAYSTFNQVLRIDPYNTAARRGQEAVNRRKAMYYGAARNAWRSKMLAEVDAIWVEALPSSDSALSIEEGDSSSGPKFSENQIKNSQNLDKIQVASVSFEGVTVEEALDFLRAEARKAGVSLNFMYVAAKNSAPAASSNAFTKSKGDDDEDEEDEEDGEDSAPSAPVAVAAKTPEIEHLVMRDISAKDLLQMICNQTGCTYRIEDKAVVVYQQGAANDNITMRRWKVAPSFFDSSSGGDDEEDAEDDEGGGYGEAAAPKKRKGDVLAALRSSGAQLTAKGSSARYNYNTNMLTVYGTQDDLDMVEEAVNDFRRKLPRMIKVTSKFVEVSQTNEEELSFDWVINPFSVSTNGSTYLGGVGGQNSSPTRTMADFVKSGGTAFANKYNGIGSWPIQSDNSILSSSSDTIGSGLMTGGNRTGSGAISANSMNALIDAGSAAVTSSRTVAPGILGLSGIYDSGSYQLIMRGLSQKKGVDVMSAPSLVLSPGDLEWTPDPDALLSTPQDDDGCAKIEVIRRFIYPVAYDAPEVQAANNNGWNNNNNNNNGNGNNNATTPVASPANPSDWAVEEVGIVMRVKVDEDETGDIINFKHFEIKVVNFEGFVNYGSPITVGITARDKIEHITLTDNRIDMPIFSRRFINSNPKIYDGHTIALGGMIEDNVQKVEDKVPVFGDLPIIGRLFRSNAESHVRKNLMIFVTAEYIDPTGRPVRHRDSGTGDAPTAGMSAPSALLPDDGVANP